ncbi:hypothetical protein Q7P37_002454 [Cladosporium fusiforme]
MAAILRSKALTTAALVVNTALAAPRPACQNNVTAHCEYDYVIVGAGASGLTVANRLSEDPDVSVLVIEAGNFDRNEDFVTIPGLAGGAIGTEYDWNISYTANPSLNGRNVSIPLGKVVGGSTKLNRMVFDRGSKSDYDRWEALGNVGWDWKSLLPYFKKNENFTPPVENVATEYNVTYDLEYHGTEGYMQSTYSPFFWPATKNMVEATKELGISISYDQANGDAIGGFYCPHNQDPATQTRSSAQEAYYETAKSRSNFELISGHRVTRVVTSANSGSVRVTGLEFVSSNNATRHSVSVKREAILAAGTIHTPQLLQVSGIGDRRLLASINVDTVVDLPAVGHNLHDHVLLVTVNSVNATLVASQLTNNETFAAEARAQYDQNRTGPLTSPTGDFLAFLPLSVYSNATAKIHASALRQNSTAYLPSDAPAEVKRGYERELQVLNDKLDADDSGMLEILWADGAVILGLQHPYSRGSVKTSSANVFDGVSADAGFLRNPLDVTLLAEGIRFARRLMSTSAMSSLDPSELVPGGDVTSDAALEEYIRSSAETLYHPAGSCKMGAREDGGVVDQDLKVYGVEGLRVVDASIMPLIPATHLMTTVYAVAEKAADIIKRDNDQE